jgi:hypothetical protein
MASTVARERACRGAFRILVRAAGMRVAKRPAPDEYEQYTHIIRRV